MDLRDIYIETLRLCAPERLVRAQVTSDMPRVVVAIGKCAGALLDGVAAVHALDASFVAIPRGYRLPETATELAIGDHPRIGAASFAAGRALLAFVDRHDDILFLISGGGSACVEVPLPPASEESVAALNDAIIASGRSIGEINERRRSVSAIKGGRLGARVRGRIVTLVHSDVRTGALADVASGPTIGDALPPPRLIADNHTLTAAAASLVTRPVVLHDQVEGTVEEAAAHLATEARKLAKGEVLIAGGEPTTTIRGPGRGGRCSELAVRFAMQTRDERFVALFAGSDGVDGNSGAAGVLLTGIGGLSATAAEDALAASDSMSVVAQVGEPIMIAPTGNNLRDLFLVARV